MIKFNKVISYIIILCFFLTLLPVQAFAQTDSNTNSTTERTTNTIVYDRKEPNIIGEIIEKREKNVKHFLRDDMTYEADIYPYTVHYLDNGKWKDIDNTLTNEVDDEGNNVFGNKDNKYKVKFSSNSNSSKLVSLKKDKYELSWTVENMENSDAQILERDNSWIETLTDNEKKKTLQKLNSAIEYKEALPGVDLQYSVIPRI